MNQAQRRKEGAEKDSERESNSMFQAKCNFSSPISPSRASANPSFPIGKHVKKSSARYAETQLIIAESKGKISHPYLQFLAGHKGDIESCYSTNKGVLPEEMIEGMRKAYKACAPFLSTISQPLEHSNIVKEAKVEALKTIAKNMLGIDLLEVKVAKEKELQKELNVDEEIELFENEIRRNREPEDDPQMTVREEDLESYLRDGWQFVSVLPSHRILIRK